MNKNFKLSGSVKKISFLLTVLVSSLILGNFVFAVWNEPTGVPPSDNMESPINVSSTPQIKSGDLYVTALYDTDDNNYYINPSADLTPAGVFKGSVGIGTTDPRAKLSVVTNNNEDSQWYSYNNTPSSDFDFIVNRARGTSDAPLPVNSTNNLGSLAFRGLESVGGNFLQAALIEASVDGTPGVGDMPAKLQFSTRPDGVGGVLTERMTIKNNGNVGIGTTNPRTKLELSDDGAILATGFYNSGWTEPNIGSGTRLLWYPKKASFRVGTVDGNQWNDVNIGLFSFGSGHSSTASGQYSTAMGYYSKADGRTSIATGFDTRASGDYSTAMGRQTVSSGDYSTALGYLSRAIGVASTATGEEAQAIGDYSTAIGGQTIASGMHSVAMGWLTTVNADRSFVLGKGASATQPLVNNVQNSLMVGFNSTIPTFFVGPSTGVGTSGNVGIGTTNPIDKLQVAGDIRIGTGTTGCVKDADGSVISGTCSSDIRLKKDVVPLKSILDSVSSLTPVSFKWRSSEYPEMGFGDSRQIGLIAQDVEKVIPELVSEDDKGFKRVNYSDLNILMLESIKELKAENDALRARIEALENDK